MGKKVETLTPVMKKLPRLKMTRMADNLIKKTQSAQLKIMHREAKKGDLELVKMYGTDLADVFCICYHIKNGNFDYAYENYYELDSDVMDMFPSTLIDMLEKAAEYERDHNGESND